MLTAQLTWRRTVLMKELMAGLNLSHSLSSRPIPLKHHSRMPPLLKIVKKSNMLTRLQLFDYYVDDINSWQVTNLESRPYMYSKQQWGRARHAYRFNDNFTGQNSKLLICLSPKKSYNAAYLIFWVLPYRKRLHKMVRSKLTVHICIWSYLENRL